MLWAVCWAAMSGSTFGAANYRSGGQTDSGRPAIADVNASVVQDLGLQGVGVSDTGRTFAQVLSEKRAQLVSPADAEAQLELLRRAMGGQLPVADNTGWTGHGRDCERPRHQRRCVGAVCADEVANQWVSELEAKEAAWNNELNLPAAAPVGTQGSLFGMPRYPVPDGVDRRLRQHGVTGTGDHPYSFGTAIGLAGGPTTGSPAVAAVPRPDTGATESYRNPLYEESLTAQDRARQYAEALQQPDLSVQQVVERWTATPATGITESDLNTATQAAERQVGHAVL